MKSQNSLIFLLSYFLMHHSGRFKAVFSKTIITEPLQWGLMKTYMKTTGIVFHLEEDAFIRGNILFSSDHSLMTTDDDSTHLVAGSDTSGYAEGQSVQAKFSFITGFLQTNSSHVLVVDQLNHCLRYINRIANQASPYVGYCTLAGLSDGLRRAARFNRPWAVIRDPINPQSALVTDEYNKAIRVIDISNGDVKTLIKDLPLYPIGLSFDSDRENLFIMSSTFLGKLNMKSLTFTQDSDWYLSLSVHTHVRLLGILCIEKVCIVPLIQELQILNLNTMKRDNICKEHKRLDSIDGTTENCTLKGPRGILLKSGTLYIGEEQAIRSISVRGFFSCEDRAIRLSAREKEKCVELITGHNICLTPGIWLYNIPEKNCTLKINITQDQNPCQNMPCLNSGICIAGEKNTYTCACRDGWTGRNCQTENNACSFNPCRHNGICHPIYYTFTCSCMAGWTGVICEKEVDACQNYPCKNSGACIAGYNRTYSCSCRGGWTGANCQTEINVCSINPCRNAGRCSASNKTFTCSCTAGWTGVLCEREVDACHSNPCLNFGICLAGGNNTYTCHCRDGWAGKNCQTETTACSKNPCRNGGTCLDHNSTFTCLCMEGWKGVICETDIRNMKCLRKIYGAADLSTMKADIVLRDGDKIKLPVGRFIYQHKLLDDTLCEIAVIVADPRITTRIDFSANYKLRCALLDQFKDLALSIAKARYSQIRQLSSEICNVSVETDVTLSCSKDIVHVVWQTDCVFNSSQIERKEMTMKVIHDNLLKTKVFHLELVIPSHIPPIVQPTLSQQGLPISVILTSFCQGVLQYHNSTDTCQ